MLATGLSRAGTVRPLLGWRTVASRRLALVVGSQCPALGQLSFLPPGAGPLDVQQLPIGQRLLIRLRDLLVDGPGECAPVEVVGQSQPGLLLNPTAATADAALGAAMTQAHEQEAVLLVYFLGHGTGQQADPAAPAQHLLHVWDTVAEPIDTEPESNGWDPYRLVIRRRPHTSGMVGLVLLVDACRAAWAKQQVDGWGGVRAGLLSAWLGSSGDHTAWDACFTRSLIQRLERGVSAAEHPRAALVPDLLAADLEALAAADCPAQAPRLGGYESHNPVLVVARNRQASDLVAELGIDGLTESLLLRLSEDYVSFAVQPVVDAARADRVVVVIGGPGTGKSTLAAALRRPPSDEVPLAMVQAIAFAAAASSVPDLARTLRGQLDRLLAGVGGHVVHAVGGDLAEFTFEVVDVGLHGLTDRPVVPATAAEVADELLLLAVHADHRLPGGDVRFGLGARGRQELITRLHAAGLVAPGARRGPGGVPGRHRLRRDSEPAGGNRLHRTAVAASAVDGERELTGGEPASAAAKAGRGAARCSFTLRADAWATACSPCCPGAQLG